MDVGLFEGGGDQVDETAKYKDEFWFELIWPPISPPAEADKMEDVLGIVEETNCNVLISI